MADSHVYPSCGDETAFEENRVSHQTTLFSSAQANFQVAVVSLWRLGLAGLSLRCEIVIADAFRQRGVKRPSFLYDSRGLPGQRFWYQPALKKLDDYKQKFDALETKLKATKVKMTQAELKSQNNMFQIMQDYITQGKNMLDTMRDSHRRYPGNAQIQQNRRELRENYFNSLTKRYKTSHNILNLMILTYEMREGMEKVKKHLNKDK